MDEVDLLRQLIQLREQYKACMHARARVRVCVRAYEDFSQSYVLACHGCADPCSCATGSCHMLIVPEGRVVCMCIRHSSTWACTSAHEKIGSASTKCLRIIRMHPRSGNDTSDQLPCSTLVHRSLPALAATPRTRG